MELLLEVCLLLLGFSGTKMWSSEVPDYQAAGKKILLSDHGNINCASEKNKTSNNFRRGYLKEEKEKCLSIACFKT